MKSMTEFKKNGFSFRPGMPNEHSESVVSRREYQAEYRCEEYALLHRKVWEEMHTDYLAQWQAINPDYYKERYSRIKEVNPEFARERSKKFRKKHRDYYKKYWQENREKLRKYYRKYRRKVRRKKRSVKH